MLSKFFFFLILILKGKDQILGKKYSIIYRKIKRRREKSWAQGILSITVSKLSNMKLPLPSGQTLLRFFFSN